MSSNDLDINSRVAIGKRHEKEILELAAKYDFYVYGKKVLVWDEATQREDMESKFDAWMSTEKGGWPVQIKYRESGKDLGLTIVMPCRNFAHYIEMYDNTTWNWDRDVIGLASHILCLAGDKLMLVEKTELMRPLAKVMKALRSEGFFGKSYSLDEIPGLELKFVTDKGAGYSYGENKIIAYYTPEFIESVGGYVYSV